MLHASESQVRQMLLCGATRDGHDISMKQFILPPEISQCAFWMCDIMESISAEMLGFSFNRFHSRMCSLWAEDANLSVYLKPQVWNENHQIATLIIVSRTARSEAVVFHCLWCFPYTL